MTQEKHLLKLIHVFVLGGVALFDYEFTIVKGNLSNSQSHDILIGKQFSYSHKTSSYI